MVPGNVGYGSRTYGKARIVVKDRELAVVETPKEPLGFIAVGVCANDIRKPPELIRVVDFAPETRVGGEENQNWCAGGGIFTTNGFSSRTYSPLP